MWTWTRRRHFFFIVPVQMSRTIFYAIPDEDEEADQCRDEYQNAKAKLNEYFRTRLNIPYKRYLFKCLRQKDGETIEQFVTRLRQGAATCAFQNADENIQDQVIEKCRSSKIRLKLLEKGDKLTLDQVRTIAATTVLIASQTKQMNVGPQSTHQYGGIHAVTNRWQPMSSMTGKTSYPGGSLPHHQGGANRRPKCYRCGREGHMAKDMNCPARDKTCNKCKKRGHFTKCCRTKTVNRRNDYQKGKSGKQGRVHNVQEDNEDTQDGNEYDAYSFNVTGTANVKQFLSLLINVR